MTERSIAVELDRTDELAGFRAQFINPDPDLIYLDGNSLGRLGAAALERIVLTARAEWGRELVRGWSRGWYDAPKRAGSRIAKLIGASDDEVIVADSTSVNLFKLATAALRLRPGRTRIVSDTLNFPSDLYVLEGCAELLSEDRRLELFGSTDGGVHPDLQALDRLLDEHTALVVLSHVVFKSGYLYDLRDVTARAHRCGALVLWDLSHSVGAAPIELDEWRADFAIGCTYKYLNGGPGSPAFLYVRREHQRSARSPIWGWFGRRSPFGFDLGYDPAPGVERFLAGTPPILSLAAMEASLELPLAAGIGRIRAKSVRATDFLIRVADERLAPLGFTVATPRDSTRRGSHVSLAHPEAYRLTRALIEEARVIPDFRAPDSIRFGVAPLYTSFTEIWDAIDRLHRLTTERRFERFSDERATVT